LGIEREAVRALTRAHLGADAHRGAQEAHHVAVRAQFEAGREHDHWLIRIGCARGGGRPRQSRHGAPLSVRAIES
jgi:hypothetical protein